MTIDWTNFFLAQLEASATLLGFLFVGVSVNLKKILSLASLARIALVGMILLIAILIVSSLLLIPNQPIRIQGFFVLWVGLAVYGIATVMSLRDVRRAERSEQGKYIRLFINDEIATSPYIIAGIMLLNGNGTGYYWLTAAVILSTILAVTDARTLLVEINR